MADERESNELSALARQRAARVEAELAEVRQRRGAYADVPARDEAANAHLAAVLAAHLAATPSAAPELAPPVHGAKTVTLGRWRAPLVGLAVAAAALLVVVRLGSRSEEPLAAYELVAQTGRSTVRSEPAKPGPTLVLERSQDLVLVARPAEPIRGPFHVRATVSWGPGVRGRPWNGSLESDPAGAVRLAAPVSELVPADVSEFDVTVQVGRPAALARDLAGEEPPAKGTLHELRLHVQLTAP